MRHSTYSCNVCGATLGERDLFGLIRSTLGLTKVPARAAEMHICAGCLSSLQKLPQVCGAGYEHCDGGPACDDDHK